MSCFVMDRDGWSRVEPDMHEFLSSCEDLAARYRISVTVQSGVRKIRDQGFTYCVSYNLDGTLERRRIRLLTCDEECDVAMCEDDQQPAIAGHWKNRVG